MKQDIIKKMFFLTKNKHRVLLPLKPIGLENFFVKSQTCQDLRNLPPNSHFLSIAGQIPYKLINRLITHLMPDGEMVIYTTEDFKINKSLFDLGTITDLITCGNHFIIRFVKNDISHQTLVNGIWKRCDFMKRLVFLSTIYPIPFNKIFYFERGGKIIINKSSEKVFAANKFDTKGITFSYEGNYRPKTVASLLNEVNWSELEFNKMSDFNKDSLSKTFLPDYFSKLKE